MAATPNDSLERSPSDPSDESADSRILKNVIRLVSDCGNAFPDAFHRIKKREKRRRGDGSICNVSSASVHEDTSLSK